MTDFFLAAFVLFVASAGIVIWQWRTAREDRKTAALSAANRKPLSRDGKEEGG